MSKYSAESANTLSGVRIRVSRLLQPRIPMPISTKHSTPLAIMAVETAVFMSR